MYLNQNAYNNTIFDNNITTKNESGSYGIYLSDNINNNTFFRNRITSLAAGIVVSGQGQAASESTRFNTFTNDTIVPCSVGCSSSYLDVNITDDAQDTVFLNVSFNKSLVRIEEGGNNFKVNWFLDVDVTNSTNNTPIANAQVVINDSNNLNIFNGTTDATGGIATQIVTEFTANGSWTLGANSDTCTSFNTNPNITCFSP